VVIPVSSIYRPWGMGFEVELAEPMESFPSGDDIADTTTMNAAMEKAIRKHPEQYLWVHKRFKTQLNEEQNTYKNV